MSKHFDKFIESLPPIVTEADLARRLQEVKFVGRASKIDKERFTKKIDKDLVSFTIKDSKSGLKKLLYSKSKEISPYEIGHRLQPKGYFSNLTAQFYWGLINEVPTSVYISSEVTRQKDSKRAVTSLDDHSIRSAFLKPPRMTSKQWNYDSFRIIFLERIHSGEVGVVTTQSRGRLQLPKSSRVTSRERTLIDSVINPQYSGGMLNVVQVFQAAKDEINMNELIKIYRSISPIYPFWQTIGFVLDLVSSKNLTEKWMKNFKIKNTFFFDKEAKSDWKLNDRWKIFYPPELL